MIRVEGGLSSLLCNEGLYGSFFCRMLNMAVRSLLAIAILAFCPPLVNTLLKTPAAKRDVPIPKCLVACLKEEREKSESEYVISNSKGTVLTETQFVRVWKYITVRSTAERCYYTYVNGQSIKHRIKPRLGEHQPNNPKLVYTMDFKVTPHMLRHTYITNLIYKGVDPKTVQYLAGHENSKTTMDIYAKVKYNKPEELSSVVNAAFGLR